MTDDLITTAARAMAEAEGWRWDNSDGPTNMVSYEIAGAGYGRSRETWRKRARVALGGNAAIGGGA